MAEAAAMFTCPSCRKRFGWKPELSGKKVRCSGCNLKLRIPAAPGGKAEALEATGAVGGASPTKPTSKAAKADDDYGLSLDDDLLGLAPSGPMEPPQLASLHAASGGGTGAAGGDKCSSCGQKVKPGAVICINCGFNLKAGKKMKTAIGADGDDAPAKGGAAAVAAAPSGLNSERFQRLAAQVKSREEADEPSNFKETKAPPILLATGIALILLDAFVLLYKDPEYLVNSLGTDDPTTAGVFRIIAAAISFVIGMPFMFIGLVLAAKMFGSAFGGMLMAIFKLASVLLATIGVNQVFDSFMVHITEGEGDFVGYLSLAVSFMAFWGAAAFVFDEIEFGEVATLFVLTFIAPFFILGFLLLTILSAFM